MKKTFLLLYIILINLTPAHSQSTWFWQQPLPTGNFLYAVDFLNENTGYAVGTVGIIMKTTNGGGNWVVQKSGTSSSLTGISIITEENAVISGYNGKILYTTNGGTNWISSASNTTNNLFGVDFPSVNTGYMCGNNGTMLKSTNGGINWNIISSGTTSSIACVSFADTLNGIAGVFRGIMKTTDGGLSWAFTELASQVLDAIVSASFNDVQHAKVLSYSLVYSTSNSGNNWNSYELPLESSNVPRTLSFGNNDTGYISTSFGDIFITTNGGLNWRNDSTFNPVYYQINILWGTFALKNSSTAFVCGAGGSVIRSTNTGNIWTPSTGNRTNLESNFFVNENTGYTVGFDGVILKTTNAGNNWLSQQVTQFRI
ncbi:MAG: YCF48-related protein [Ignavibacteria bacterium]